MDEPDQSSGRVLDSDARVYCDIQMSLDEGHQLLRLVDDLQRSNLHPHLDSVFNDMKTELSGSIEIATIRDPRAPLRRL